ncbi:MAG: sensor domain-containing protein, partial [Stackebrandtia sp.]
MTYSSPPATRALSAAVRCRVRRLGWVFALLLSQISAAILFVGFVVSIPLVFLTIGIPLTVGCVYANRWLCQRERVIYRREFGVTINDPYRQRPRGRVGKQLILFTKDATMWRDFAWQVINFTLGTIVSVTYIGM